VEHIAWRVEERWFAEWILAMMSKSMMMISTFFASSSSSEEEDCAVRWKWWFCLVEGYVGLLWTSNDQREKVVLESEERKK
jgi:Na+-transporting NADH:ubiquinone oxidoreductase subunit NqrB